MLYDTDPPCGHKVGLSPPPPPPPPPSTPPFPQLECHAIVFDLHYAKTKGKKWQRWTTQWRSRNENRHWSKREIGLQQAPSAAQHDSKTKPSHAREPSVSFLAVRRTTNLWWSSPPPSSIFATTLKQWERAMQHGILVVRSKLGQSAKFVFQVEHVSAQNRLGASSNN